MGAIDVPAGLDPSQSARLEGATTTSQETFALSSFLLIAFSFVVLCFALSHLPWSYFRIQHHGFSGWSLSSSPAPIKRARSILGGHKHHEDRDAASIAAALPKRRGKFPFAVLSTVTIPRIGLSVPQATLLVIAIVIITIACFAGEQLFDGLYTYWIRCDYACSLRDTAREQGVRCWNNYSSWIRIGEFYPQHGAVN